MVIGTLSRDEARKPKTQAGRLRLLRNTSGTRPDANSHTAAGIGVMTILSIAAAKEGSDVNSIRSKLTQSSENVYGEGIKLPVGPMTCWIVPPPAKYPVTVIATFGIARSAENMEKLSPLRLSMLSVQSGHQPRYRLLGSPGSSKTANGVGCGGLEALSKRKPSV